MVSRRSRSEWDREWVDGEGCRADACVAVFLTEMDDDWKRLEVMDEAIAIV
jgi:hypothetical protein